MEIATMSEIGRWVAVYDDLKKPFVDDPGSLTWVESGRDPGWRIAWDFGRKLAWYGDMTFGRAEDAAQAVKALYTLDDWQCASLEEARATTMRITRAKMRQTILEAMAW
jgi:hypothetical protein